MSGTKVAINPTPLACRLQHRLNAMVERDGSVQQAIEGQGIGLSYLFVKELATALSAVPAPLSVPNDLRKMAKAARRDDLLDAGLHDNKWKFAQAAAAWVETLLRDAAE